VPFEAHRAAQAVADVSGPERTPKKRARDIGRAFCVVVLSYGLKGFVARKTPELDMEIKQQLRLSQQLVMTPQLQQAIRLLQLSRLELIEEVRKELDNNPMLSDEEPDRGRDPSELRANNEAARNNDEPGPYFKTSEQKVQERAHREVDWEKFLENRTLQQSPSPGRGGFEELPPIEQNLTKPRNLRDHMLWQLQMSELTDVERRFAELVIGNLDDKGYLDLAGVERPDGTRTPDLTIEDLAEEAGLHPDDAPLVLQLIQNFDPIGVGARDLRECLLIQAESAGYEESDVLVQMIKHHLHHLEKHNYQAIVREMKIPLEDVYEAAKEIQGFESRPARNFTDQDDRSIGITPDVYVIKDGDDFVVLDNDRGIQRLFINEALTKRLMKDPSAKEFVGEKLRNAQWLIRAIEQRRKTIIRVAECIIEKQREFFEKGVSYLKPMILRDVAEAVGMHESTISRVTTNKYMHCPQGLFELKYFFNSSIRRVANEDIASESVKQAIKKLIEEEDKANPISDQQIVEMLEQTEGIKIARRTVAKYRELLGILASSKRKRLF
jgi:RNA polymerase sigma-54 factor